MVHAVATISLKLLRIGCLENLKRSIFISLVSVVLLNLTILLGNRAALLKCRPETAGAVDGHDKIS